MTLGKTEKPQNPHRPYNIENTKESEVLLKTCI